MIKLDISQVNEIVPEIEVVGIEDEVVAYRFIDGPYKGISYTYSNVKFEEAGDHLEVVFGFIVFENANAVDVDEKDFRKTIGDILVKVIEAAVDNATTE